MQNYKSALKLIEWATKKLDAKVTIKHSKNKKVETLKLL
jgi:hypothetical protein